MSFHSFLDPEKMALVRQPEGFETICMDYGRKIVEVDSLLSKELF